MFKKDIPRRKSRQIKVGNVLIGGDAPISVQTMTNTETTDVDATVAQIERAAKVGAAAAGGAILGAILGGVGGVAGRAVRLCDVVFCCPDGRRPGQSGRRRGGRRLLASGTRRRPAPGGPRGLRARWCGPAG